MLVAPKDHQSALQDLSAASRRELIELAARYNVAFLGLMGAIFVLFARPIVAGFTSDPAVTEVAVFGLRIMAAGFPFFAFGMGKKILLANPCGKVADTVFDAGAATTLDAWYGVSAYAFQIYFDFSAYSDMAIGLGLMLGWVFAKNFDSPYQSQSITEFWRRWHLSLSTWLRDNLYIPLGGNRRGEVRTYCNLLATMVLGGLWHGASWTFIIWIITMKIIPKRI
jgi:D-alanyl-lipoteichoic acid acyltransferase DltB (MBOAT superfamily)